jgi:hypothetical protein
MGGGKPAIALSDDRADVVIAWFNAVDCVSFTSVAARARAEPVA